MSVLPVCASVHCVCVQCPQISEEGIEFPGTGVTDGCEWPYQSWESNLDSLEGLPVLLTSLHP